MACDLVIARAGGSVFEIAAAGKPAILAPYPHATASHQDTNARWMERGGAAVVVPDAELSGERLRAEVQRILSDPERTAKMGAASHALARLDAAAHAVAAEVLAAARSPDRPTPDPGPPPDLPWQGRRLHFMGIGGAGMSGLALIADLLRAEVSGCDRAESDYMLELRQAGIEFAIGHDATHVEPGLELGVSTAIPPSTPRLLPRVRPACWSCTARNCSPMRQSSSV